jgi:hypothetical protein
MLILYKHSILTTQKVIYEGRIAITFRLLHDDHINNSTTVSNNSKWEGSETIYVESFFKSLI